METKKGRIVCLSSRLKRLRVDTFFDTLKLGIEVRFDFCVEIEMQIPLFGQIKQGLGFWIFFFYK